jgi:hypothetical protein
MDNPINWHEHSTGNDEPADVNDNHNDLLSSASAYLAREQRENEMKLQHKKVTHSMATEICVEDEDGVGEIELITSTRQFKPSRTAEADLYNAENSSEGETSQDLLTTAGSTTAAVYARSQAIVVWKDLKVSAGVRGKRKQLLNNISGVISGGLWAIIGPSGSG